jgi:diguanylate cyclase (GGDEF)-like protein
MNIGLLVSEIEDREVKRIIIGADQAARDKDVTLVILPGKYLINETSDDEHPHDYQYSALFDYANTPEFDVLIIDSERICKKTTILKKQAFLKKFEGIPVLTLSEEEGYTNVNQPPEGNDKFSQLGYEAVCDAIFYAKNQVLPPAEAARNFNFVEVPESDVMRISAEASYYLLNMKYDTEKVYSKFLQIARNQTVKNCGIFTYDKKIRNTLKYPWTRPEQITVKAAMIGGNEIQFEDESMVMSTDKILSYVAQNKSRTLIAGNIFVGEYQLGLLVTEYGPGFLTDRFFNTILSLVTGASRLSYLEKELDKTLEELYEVQEELARDDSVLDHIGDQDYLTGGLNRRGFFAKAYDHLKDNFGPGKSAVVAYIHMESLKMINGMYGHEEGDRAVRRVSQILEEVFGGSIYGRIRGDEFAVLVITDEDGKAEALRQEMSTQNARLLSEPSRYINNLQYSICEFGYEENLSLREMLKETDENLKRIKGNL